MMATVLHLKSPADDPEIRRTRKILLIILGICFVLFVISSIFVIVRSEVVTQRKNIRRGTQIGQALVSIIFYSFGLFATYRYFALGLQVFARLYIIKLVVTVIWLLIVPLFNIMDHSFVYSIVHDVKTSLITTLWVIVFIFIGICIAIFILSVIIVKWTFKLAQLIDANQCLIIQQI